jgi:hypothetical protein
MKSEPGLGDDTGVRVRAKSSSSFGARDCNHRSQPYSARSSGTKPQRPILRSSGTVSGERLVCSRCGGHKVEIMAEPSGEPTDRTTKTRSCPRPLSVQSRVKRDGAQFPRRLLGLAQACQSCSAGAAVIF